MRVRGRSQALASAPAEFAQNFASMHGRKFFGHLPSRVVVTEIPAD